MLAHTLIGFGFFVWFWMGYISWRALTQKCEYLKLGHFLGLFGCLFLPIIPFLVCCGEELFEKNINIVICKRWLSKREKIELVKKRIRQ
jgi:hypothetical protein